jgi:anti-anti-sigma regulatory factor
MSIESQDFEIGVTMSTDSVVLHEDSLCRIEQSTHPSGLRLYGSLRGDARPILERELDEALRDGRDLYVDLSHIDFVSVGCMRTLMDAAAYLQLDGCRLLLLGPNPAVRLIIAICQQTGPRNVEVLPCPT